MCREHRLLAIVGICALVVPLSLTASDPEATPPVLPMDQHQSAAGIEWETGFPYENATLVVQGARGRVFEKNLSAGEPLSFGLTDALGAPLLDGSYTWQLTIRRTLSSFEAAAMESAEANAARLRSESDRLRIASVETASTSVPDANSPESNASVDIAKSQSAARAAEIAEEDVDRLRARLEEQSGRFVVRRSGEFAVLDGQVEFEAIQDRGISLERADPAGSPDEAASRDNATPEPTENFASIAKDYISGDLQVSSGICVGCASGTSVPTGEFAGYAFRADGPTPFLYLDDSDGTSAWLIGNYTGDYFRIQDWDGGSIPFKIEESTPSDTLHLDSTGNIGIMEAAPLENIHITDPVPGIRFEDSNDSTYGMIRYNAGHIVLEGNTAQNIVEINGTAPSASLFIASQGIVGIGTNTPSVFAGVKGLDINHTMFPAVRFIERGSGQTWALYGGAGGAGIFDETANSVPIGTANGAPNNALWVAASGNVGLGTPSATSSLDIRRNDGTAKIYVQETNGTTALRTQFHMINNGPVNTQHETGGAVWRQQFQDNAYTLTKNGTGGNEMTIIAGSGDTTIRGRLYTAGPTCGAGCDAVLGPDFTVESIEDHAAAMWSGGFLPAIGPTVPEQPMNITEKVGGVLNELEKAHIYIEQLHQELAQQKEQLQRLEALINENIIE